MSQPGDETNDPFAPPPQEPPAAPPPGYGQQPYGAPPPGYGMAPPPFGAPLGGPRPSNYLPWAILSTILCCLPLGVASIVFANQVNTK